MTPETCPIVRRANGLSIEVKRGLRRLQKTFNACQACSKWDECEAVQRVQEWVAQAAQEVLDELGS